MTAQCLCLCKFLFGQLCTVFPLLFGTYLDHICSQDATPLQCQFNSNVIRSQSFQKSMSHSEFQKQVKMTSVFTVFFSFSEWYILSGRELHNTVHESVILLLRSSCFYCFCLNVTMETWRAANKSLMILGLRLILLSSHICC